jgi:hypothetical protein
MAALPPVGDAPDILLRLNRAHEAMHDEINAHQSACNAALADLWKKHAPFITEAKSVFLQVQAEAYRAGFTDDEINTALPGCE